ncbi:hypothetical protein DMH04_51300 [Kibdelosporangium aridum]|uniref:WXG100 family type VII secretion target n=1 Tax=Kibdelosporangium aridum TaxID=2030 RepID=A0A428YA20_KIBAR|nr:hypothetical protein [Kibdelosporangium aridum]RSM64476.1 hypothetical protein DMH04_51300 [Kibdelosporangium aridum]
MTAPGEGRQPDFAIDPDHMTRKIGLFLTPVVEQLDKLAGRYDQAHGEVTAAHASQAGGWFGGIGNNEIRSASSSFLNALEWQLRQVKDDQKRLAASLLDYENSLHQIIALARRTDQMIADRFQSIANQLDQMGR